MNSQNSNRVVKSFEPRQINFSVIECVAGASEEAEIVSTSSTNSWTSRSAYDWWEFSGEKKWKYLRKRLSPLAEWFRESLPGPKMCQQHIQARWNLCFPFVGQKIRTRLCVVGAAGNFFFLGKLDTFWLGTGSQSHLTQESLHLQGDYEFLVTRSTLTSEIFQ